jgi:hypothetical protein
MTRISAGALGKAPTSEELDLAQSVAGEEDPGASVSPGDEAVPGTPGTGERPCPDCGGSGRQAGRDCPACQGTGKVTAGIGGA